MDSSKNTLELSLHTTSFTPVPQCCPGDGNPTGLCLDVEGLCWSRAKSLSLEELWKPPHLGKKMGKPLVLVGSLIYSVPGLVILVWNRFGAFSSALLCLSHFVLHLLNYTPRVGRGGSEKELLAPRNEPLVLKRLLKFQKRQ